MNKMQPTFRNSLQFATALSSRWLSIGREVYDPLPKQYSPEMRFEIRADPTAYATFVTGKSPRMTSVLIEQDGQKT